MKFKNPRGNAQDSISAPSRRGPPTELERALASLAAFFANSFLQAFEFVLVVTGLLRTLVKGSIINLGYGQLKREQLQRERCDQSLSMSALRELYLRLLELAGQQAHRATHVPKHKSIRRRIFEWSKRG